MQRTAWLKHQWVYWSGTAPRIPFASQVAYRPITQIIADRLAGHPPGIYAVRFSFSGPSSDLKAPPKEVVARVNPSVVELLPVTRQLLARTAQALAESKKYPKVLPKVVEDVTTWRTQAENRLRRVTKALQAVSVRARDAPHSLALEETCLWI